MYSADSPQRIGASRPYLSEVVALRRVPQAHGGPLVDLVVPAAVDVKNAKSNGVSAFEMLFGPPEPSVSAF